MTACTIHAEAGCVTLHDGTDEVVEIEGAFDRNHRPVDPCDPACVMLVAGPRANGKWVTVVWDCAKPGQTLH